MAGQFGVFVGNGFVGLFNIDRTAECQTVTNNVARFVLGIDQACSKFSIGNVTVGNVSLSFPDMNWIVVKNNGSITCRFKFTKFFVNDDDFVDDVSFRHETSCLRNRRFADSAIS